MKTQSLVLTVMAALLIFSGDVLAAPGGGGGGGGGEIPDYGDLIILYRDNQGVPIHSPEAQVPDPETGLPVDGGLCWQPIAFNESDEVGALCPSSCVTDSIPSGAAVVAVNQYNCGVAEGCAGCTQEVDFGRMNAARSPDSVFASQLDDVIVNLATADCITLDPAGRLVTSRVETVEDDLPDLCDDDITECTTDQDCIDADLEVCSGEYVDVVTSGAIDSPLQNLAIYRQLVMYGYLGDAASPIQLPADILTTAARGLGVSSDKGGEVNVDMVAYLNSIMGLDDVPTILPKICETYREEVQGVIMLVEKCFLDYKENPVIPNVPPAAETLYCYRRNMNFNNLPAPAYIPPIIRNEFEYLYEVSDTPTFGVAHGRVLDAVFCVNEFGPVLPTTANGVCNGEIEQFRDKKVRGFAQAADDTRAVINFMHGWALPAVYETPLVCETADNGTRYDLSISEESGLQVPVQMVSTTEGREFIVTVANAGPDTANGSVLVTAITADNDSTSVVEIEDPENPLDGPYWMDGAERFEFPIVDLEAGMSASWTVFFNIREPMATTLTWTATAVAGEQETDVNMGNNTVTATSNITLTGGGAGEP